MLELTDNPDINAVDFVTAKQAADTLHKHYPGHLWAVTCDAGVLSVRNLYLSGNWGFIIRLGPVYSASELDKLVMEAGGEILERYNVSRGMARQDQIRSLPERAGHILFDGAEAKTPAPKFLAS